MQYKHYRTKLTTKSRMARKHMRRDVFVTNNKMAKKARKAKRLARKALDEGETE